MNANALKKGTIIFRQGEPSDCMSHIHWGTVGIYANYQTPEEKQFAVLREGQFFGEMGMIEGCPRSATAVVLESGTKIRQITPETFEGYFKDRPAQVLMVLQNMSHRLRELTGDYLKVCRAVAEAAETEQTGAAKSERLKEQLEQIAAADRAGADDHPNGL